MSEHTASTKQKTLQQALENFWLLAQAICVQVESWQPDLVIALLHSGEGPLRAALAVWDETHDVPFPPVMRTNLGREKVWLYDELREHLGKDQFRKWVDDIDEEAHLLAWAAGQYAWQAELADQAGEVLGEDAAPDRVLVVDDFAREGTTWLLALGLLKTVFPQTEARYVASSLSDWGGDLAMHWLQEHYPDVYAAMEADTPAHHRLIGQLTCFDHLRRIAPGTEDVDPELLTWRPLTADSESVQALTRFLPAETWLTIPASMYETTEVFVRRRTRETSSVFTRGGSPDPVSTVRTSPDARPCATVERLTPTHLILRHAWLTRHVTRRDVAVICRVSPTQATRLLAGLVKRGYLVRHGQGRSTWYDLRPVACILAYGDLLADPGPEIEAAIERRIEQVETPFEVEYARSSQGRAGAPTLVPVPDGKGARVQAQVFVLRPDIGLVGVWLEMYLRVMGPVRGENATQEHQAQPVDRPPILFERMPDLPGVPLVSYTNVKPNLDFVLQDDLPAETKAERLAQLAVDSVTPETFRENRDGIRYLADAIRHGIHTPLTDLYREAILRLAGDAPNLEEARWRIARQKGISVEEQP